MINYNLEQVLPLGVLTGSRAFNCSTKDSDWDIVIVQADLPNYQFAVDYTRTDFLAMVEYDKSTIWGPLEQIVKYWDDNGNCINLFVYNDNHVGILEKFKELNTLMNFLHGSKLQDKNYRIEAFTNIINKVGITNYTYP